MYGGVYGAASGGAAYGTVYGRERGHVRGATMSTTDFRMNASSEFSSKGPSTTGLDWATDSSHLPIGPVRAQPNNSNHALFLEQEEISASLYVQCIESFWYHQVRDLCVAK